MGNKSLGTGEPGHHPARKVRVVLSGLSHAVLYDFSVAYKLVLSAVILTSAFVLRQWVDALVILVATALVLVAELLSSAIEGLCDLVETEENRKIGVIKDIAAAAAGVAVAVWAVVLVVEGSRLWSAHGGG
jgi:diacylglycerol kinase (ATP)